MKIVVIGGTGLIGSKLVTKLRADGHDPLAASPATGVDIITGKGLAEALAGAHVVVDVSNAPNWGDAEVMDFFQTSARTILAAETAAGTGRHVALSVVGTERLQGSGYFRAKLAQEEAIKAGEVPSTILRATQFFEFIGGIAQEATKGQEVTLPSALMQPMSADDVAAAVADYTLGPALNRIVEVAGPEALGIDEAVRRHLTATGDARRVITDDDAPYYGVKVSERTLTPDNAARLGPTRLEDWLGQFAHAGAVTV